MPPERTCNCMTCNKCCEREYARKVHRLKAYGEWEPKGDIDKVRAHLETLRTHRIGAKRISALTGLSRSTIFRVRSGQNEWVTKAVADAILSVQPDDTLRVNPVGTSRRIRALMALGWTTYYMAERLGVKQHRVWELSKARAWVKPETHAAVRDLYDELCMTQGPSKVTRSRARTAGFLPPLAWDDIDNPDETPSAGPGRAQDQDRRPWDDYDESRVERIIGGDWPLAAGARKAERVAVITRWRGSLNELEQLTGWKIERDWRIRDNKAIA